MVDVNLSKITALAVEDDAGGSALIGSLMRRLGINAFVDSSGLRTLELAQDMEPPPDIILLDLNLPRKSGFEILQEIRADEKLKDVLVVAVTAMDASIAIPKCKAAGFNGYIAKPLRRQKFGEQLTRVLAGEEVWDAN